MISGETVRTSMRGHHGLRHAVVSGPRLSVRGEGEAGVGCCGLACWVLVLGLARLAFLFFFVLFLFFSVSVLYF